MKVLVVVAHPDDETILTGGALALLARAGAKVYYLCATRGEGGELGEPPLCERAELGRVREHEMRCAVQTLGGAGVDFLDYVDPLVGEDDELFPYTSQFDLLTKRLRDHYKFIQPDAVITHGSSGEYGHPAHVLTHKAVVEAVQTNPTGARILYTFNADFPGHPRPRHANTHDPADLVLNIAPVFQQKVDAALCHRTQGALFVRRSSKRAGRALAIPDVLMGVEGLHRVAGSPDDSLMGLLEPFRWKG